MPGCYILFVSATERLYYRDCYLSSFQASVIDTAENGCRVYLDRTAFYPSSGGQPNDLGSLGGQAVLDVQDEGERVAHVAAGPVKSGLIEGIIDWSRRYDHMQQHTGQHLLSAVFVDLFGFQTVSFHMGSDLSTIELATKELSDGQIDRVEERVNQLAREARPVRIEFGDGETVQGLRKPSQRSGTLRIINIENVDRSACGGTHVRSTAELGPIQVRRSEKIRGNVRVEFVCGDRALRRMKQDFWMALNTARQLSVPMDTLPEHVSSLKRRLADAEKDLQKMRIELAKRDGSDLYRNTPAGVDGVRRVVLEVPSIDESVRAKVQAFAGMGHAILLVVGIEPAGVLLACSPDSGLNAGRALSQALSAAGGRGGGSPTLAQGSLTDVSVVGVLKRELGFPLTGQRIGQQG